MQKRQRDTKKTERYKKGDIKKKDRDIQKKVRRKTDKGK